ncbi:GNAT family N-acetyltransferase [Plastorhodobacter daqingensis]|uniref:GNAT family N-acetyltransferase n=1 Tax=Plastorhodobacter daqingensis TaxID=1387281 RepID=A0ABW2UNQ5_9RHOB
MTLITPRLEADLPVVPTERFVLRPLRRSDAGPIAMYGADRRVATQTTSIPHPYPPGAAEAFVARAMSGDGAQAVWALDGSAHGGSELLGLVSLSRLDRAQAEIGYWVAPALWNTGYASEAVQAIVAANPLGNKTMFAQVFQDNPGSARVLTNAGFVYLGDAEAFSVARGAMVPTWTYLRKLD